MGIVFETTFLGQVGRDMRAGSVLEILDDVMVRTLALDWEV